MKLKVNAGMGSFEVENIEYLPDINKSHTLPNKQMYYKLMADDRFIVYKGNTFGASEVYIKEGTEVEMTRLSRCISEGMQIIVGDYVFYIPNLAYMDEDLLLVDEPYSWEDFSDEQLKERGVELYEPLWKKLKDIK